MNYCMQCGSPNPLTLNTCKKCGNSLKPGIPPAPKLKTKAPAGGRPTLAPKQADPPSRTRDSSLVIPSMVTANEDDEIDDTEEDDDDSIDFVPDVSQLEFDPIPTIEVRGVTFASLVADAEREKKLKGQQ